MYKLLISIILFCFVIELNAQDFDSVSIELKLERLFNSFVKQSQKSIYDYSLLFKTEEGYNYVQYKVLNGSLAFRYKQALVGKLNYFGVKYFPLVEFIKDGKSYSEIYCSKDRVAHILNPYTNIPSKLLIDCFDDDAFKDIEDYLLRHQSCTLNFIPYFIAEGKLSGIPILKRFIENLDTKNTAEIKNLELASLYLIMLEYHELKGDNRKKFLIEFLNRNEIYHGNGFFSDWALQEILKSGDAFYLPNLRNFNIESDKYNSGFNEKYRYEVKFLLARKLLGDAKFTYKERKLIKRENRLRTERAKATKEFTELGIRHYIKYNRKGYFKKYKKYKKYKKQK